MNLNINQSAPSEVSLYAGLTTFTLKSFGLDKDQLVAKGYSEGFGNAFGSKVDQDDDGNATAKVTAILYNEELDLEIPLVLNLSEKTRSSDKGTSVYIGDHLRTSWYVSPQAMQAIVEDTSRNENYRNMTKLFLDHNGRLAKQGELSYYNFLSAILHPKASEKNTDGTFTNLLPAFIKNIRENGMDVESILGGNFKGIQALPGFTNNTENKQLDKIVCLVSIITKDSGQQNMQIITDYDGGYFFRMGVGGQVTAPVLAKVKAKVEAALKDEYAAKLLKGFYLVEPIRKVTIQDLLATPESAVAELPDTDTEFDLSQFA